MGAEVEGLRSLVVVAELDMVPEMLEDDGLSQQTDDQRTDSRKRGQKR